MNHVKIVLFITVSSYFFGLSFPVHAMYGIGARTVFARQEAPHPFHDQFPGQHAAKSGSAKPCTTQSHAARAHPMRSGATKPLLAEQQEIRVVVGAQAPQPRQAAGAGVVQEPQISYARLAGFLSKRNWGYFENHNELVVQAALKKLESSGNLVYGELCDMMVREEEYFCDAQEYVGEKCDEEGKKSGPLFSPGERADLETDFVAVLLGAISKLVVADIHKGFRRIAAQEATSKVLRGEYVRVRVREKPATKN